MGGQSVRVPRREQSLQAVGEHFGDAVTLNEAHLYRIS
jgi:hypothetical protein